MLKEESNINLIMQLLEEKNELLRLFLEISEKERRSFKARNFDNLEILYVSREELLENIQCIDKRLDLYSAKENPETITPEQKSKITKTLETKQLLVNEILSQDLVMLSCIDNEKSGLIKKISSVRTGRRLMKAYRRLPDIVE
ncbi:MAG: hypothetical protein H6623_04450 [Bdellovibrionaceae bacterium]|nr:hypothetical protein [Pseudobdellovibrionaceae bacterium]